MNTARYGPAATLAIVIALFAFMTTATVNARGFNTGKNNVAQSSEVALCGASSVGFNTAETAVATTTATCPGTDQLAGGIDQTTAFAASARLACGTPSIGSNTAEACLGPGVNNSADPALAAATVASSFRHNPVNNGSEDRCGVGANFAPGTMAQGFVGTYRASRHLLC